MADRRTLRPKSSTNVEEDMDTGNDDMDMNMGGMMMQMYFYVSSQATILFKSWNTTTWAGMFGSFIAVFFIAMIYESIKVLRNHLIRTSQVRARRQVPQVTEYTQLNPTGNPDENPTTPHVKAAQLICSRDHFIQTALHFVQATLGYSLMLVAMTFNFWLFLAVVLGMTAGYFTFGWKPSPHDFNDDCCA